ncbi:hypothetical protein GCM10027612_38900 [Microbispora bryophytorum subsp. camponoti]
MRVGAASGETATEAAPPGRRPGTRGMGPGGTTHDKTIEIESDEEELPEGATWLRVG